MTWESIAHAGPDPDHDLDLEYIAYLKSLIKLMPKYGLKCFICAHQDVWSRFSGGSGAPGWTFEAAGLDIEAFMNTGAAYVHGQDEMRRLNGPVDPREPSGPFVWPSGYQKLAASTMATVFWAGDALAPMLRCSLKSVDGGGISEEVSVQSFLQDSMIEAFGRLSDEVGGLETCIGFEPMNEPHRGLVNLHDFHGWNYDTDLHIGHYPSLAQALALGSGYAQDVPFYVKSWPFPTRVLHRSRVDPKGRSAWLPNHGTDTLVHQPRGLGGCVWRAHGVWEWDEVKQTARILDPTYFDHDHRPGREGQKLEWYRDCYAPFIKKFSERVSHSHPHHMSFIEPIPNEFMPPWPEKGEQFSALEKKQKYATKTRMPIDHTQNMVYAPHFYDLNVLFSKIHSWMSVNVQGLSRGMFVLRALYFGTNGLKDNYRRQIGNLIRHGKMSLDPKVPSIIGEIGIPWDINSAYAFKTGDYDCQRGLIDALITAMEDTQVGFTLWNYNPDNTMEHGDGWNKEDFSIVNGCGTSRPDYRNAKHEKDGLYRGGRALDVIIRPYAVKTAGTPVSSNWDHRALRFEFCWIPGDVSRAEIGSEESRRTLIFLPSYHYAGHQLVIELNHGQWEHDAEQQTLVVRNDSSDKAVKHRIVVKIQDERAHIHAQAVQRRRVFPPGLPLSLIPVSVEIWWDMLEVGYFQILALVFLIVAVTLGVLRE